MKKIVVVLTAAFVLLSVWISLPAVNTDAADDSRTENIEIGLASSNAVTSGVAASPKLYLPVMSYQTDLLCRFGVNGTVANIDLASLKAGWYVDYQASLPASVTRGTEQFPVIRLFQTSPTTYDYSPKGSELITAVTANPGAHWLIGNEPDRRGYQDDMIPSLYAAAYREVHGVIKTADPSARVLAGTIVQPTPLRLKYLDLVLSSYLQAYGTAMPVDGWSIHNFILNEVSCEYDPNNCWGAEIPPGLSDNFGEIVSIEDNDNIVLFKERIVRFRQWMKTNGYQDKPLYLTEYGVLMPQWLGFNVSRVNQFMTASFDYLNTAVDPALGDPNDGYRLVQRWSWYSTTDNTFNGWLFDPNTRAIKDFGVNFAAYTSGVARQVDFYPSSIAVTAQDTDTYTITARIANTGNSEDLTSGSVQVLIKQGITETEIGSKQIINLRGCGTNQAVSVVWDNVTPGSYTIIVRAAGMGDQAAGNNELQKSMTIP